MADQNVSNLMSNNKTINRKQGTNNHGSNLQICGLLLVSHQKYHHRTCHLTSHSAQIYKIYITQTTPRTQNPSLKMFAIHLPKAFKVLNNTNHVKNKSEIKLKEQMDASFLLLLLLFFFFFWFDRWMQVFLRYTKKIQRKWRHLRSTLAKASSTRSLLKSSNSILWG